MTHRAARPLRLLQSSWSVGLDRGGVGGGTLAVYKPSGLPYFSASQVSACTDGRHLFAASTRSVPPVKPTDASDSLLSRVTDSLPPGSGTPRVAFPLVHPALSRCCTPSQLNAVTAQRKGTSLVACAPHEFMFLRNCHRLHLVRSVYRVVCRLPPCVSGRVRRALREKNAVERTTESVFKNPYVQQHLNRSHGISSSSGKIPLGGGSGGSLPRCAYPHPLLQGGFINVKERCFLSHGTVSGYLTGYRLPRDVETVVKQQERLKTLFLTPTSSSSSSLSHVMNTDVDSERMQGGCDICQRKMHGEDETTSHMWIGPGCRIRVSLDVKVTRGKEEVANEALDNEGYDNDEGVTLHSQAQLTKRNKKNVRHVDGKPFKFEFRLVTLSDACDLALYEVSTNNASDEEIKTAFAACNMTVVNDFVNDPLLAEAMYEVARELHTVPHGRLAQLPMVAQHMLREGSPLELVAEPLLANTLFFPTDAATKSEADVLNSGEQQRVSQLTGLRGLHFRLLLEALAKLKDGATYRRVAQLAFGGGLECTALHFPDPRSEANMSAVQHLLLRLEEREVSESYCNSVAERMSFISRGTAVDCETYASMLQGEGIIEGIPPQSDVATVWGGAGHPTVMRWEEYTELGCAYCGASGHVWSACPEGVPLLSNRAANDTVEENNKERSDDNTKGTSVITPKTSNFGEKNITDEMLLTTVDDVTDALEDITRRQSDAASVISIPNTAATQVFNPHAWRREQKRPALHKHRLRCAYCSGHHHITQCPKLSSGDMYTQPGSCSTSRTLDKEHLRIHGDKLFCIKCGKYGHLYDACPLTPQGLHRATHCPICLQPHRKIQHEPSQCPRRVTPPQDYLSSGVPARFIGSGRGGKKKARGGCAVLLSDSFLSNT